MRHWLAIAVRVRKQRGAAANGQDVSRETSFGTRSFDNERCFT
jgi:hypothetical protein